VDHRRGLRGRRDAEPTYEEVCSARTGHTEAVLVVFDPVRGLLRAVLKLFWEGHDPTQGMRQGNDVGTQYRSAIYWRSEAQRAVAEASRDAFQRELTAAGLGQITTEIAPPASSSTPRATTSSTSPRCPTATAAWAGRA
jgi:peptide-methionine (S)-S-oxide reductase